MAEEELSNAEKLQACSKLMSRLILLEKVYRQGTVLVDDETYDFPDAFKNTLKAKFATLRSELIAELRSITAQ